MKKLRLALDQLHVESFHAVEHAGQRGTVGGHDSWLTDGANTCKAWCSQDTGCQTCDASCNGTCYNTCGQSCAGTCLTCGCSAYNTGCGCETWETCIGAMNCA